MGYPDIWSIYFFSFFFLEIGPWKLQTFRPFNACLLLRSSLSQLSLKRSPSAAWQHPSMVVCTSRSCSYCHGIKDLWAKLQAAASAIDALNMTHSNSECYPGCRKNPSWGGSWRSCGCGPHPHIPSLPSLLFWIHHVCVQASPQPLKTFPLGGALQALCSSSHKA